MDLGPVLGCCRFERPEDGNLAHLAYRMMNQLRQASF